MTDDPEKPTEYTFDGKGALYLSDQEDRRMKPALLDSTLRIFQNDQLRVTIHPDGSVEIAPGYTPKDAALAFWEAVEGANPMRQEVDRLREALHRHHFESAVTDAACPVCYPDDWQARAALAGKKEGLKKCDHLWGYQNQTDPLKCYKCGAPRPICELCRQSMYGPVNGWEGDPDDPKAYSCSTKGCPGKHSLPRLEARR